ncbi:MAG: hypothetical protein CM1200mP2_27430 [Planctomycetaceae bacterium]|nr:MAG: hypothetical protein CM1200mP2_27430 [Planctomycetaceae bacterium]
MPVLRPHQVSRPRLPETAAVLEAFPQHKTEEFCGHLVMLSVGEIRDRSDWAGVRIRQKPLLADPDFFGRAGQKFTQTRSQEPSDRGTDYPVRHETRFCSSETEIERREAAHGSVGLIHSN